MQKLKLIFSDVFENYELAEKIKESIGFLSIYLHDMPYWNIPNYIQWALNSNEFNNGTNCTWLEKKGQYIFIGSVYNDPKAKLQYFKILIPEFVKVLTEWEKLVKAKAQKITITQADDGTMTIEGE